jgi:hypothetical protein
VYNPSKPTIKICHCSGNGKRSISRNAQSTVRTPKTILKYCPEFYLYFTKHYFSHTHWDWALYAWTSLHACRVRIARESPVLRQSSLSLGRGPFNLHLPGGFSFVRVWEDRVPGAITSEYRLTTVWGIFRGLVVSWRSLIFFYLGESLWRRYDLEALGRCRLLGVLP